MSTEENIPPDLKAHVSIYSESNSSQSIQFVVPLPPELVKALSDSFSNLYQLSAQ